MSKPILFMVHGMGNHAKGWADSTINELDSRFQGYQTGSNKEKFTDLVDVIPIQYDSVFEHVRGNWEKTEKEIKQFLGTQKVPKNLVTSIAKWSQLGVDDSFFWTHVLDVLLYRSSETIQLNAEILVTEAILKNIEPKKRGGFPRWSILAHSLGASVTSNALHRLFFQNIKDSSLSYHETRPELLMMVANTARVLQSLDSSRKVYNTIKPGVTADGGCACRYYYTVHNDFDPFTWPKRFEPGQSWPDAQTAASQYYKPISVNHVHQANTHDLNHYLRHPAVHLPLFKRLLGDIWIDPSLERDSIQHFEQVAVNELLRQALSKINPSVSDAWDKYIRAGKKFSDVLQRFG